MLSATFSILLQERKRQDVSPRPSSARHGARSVPVPRRPLSGGQRLPANVLPDREYDIRVQAFYQEKDLIVIILTLLRRNM